MKQRLNSILLIDDNEANNYLSRLVLEELDCVNCIKTELSANAALDYLIHCGTKSDQHCKLPFPDLIFLDINMPAVDGWEFLEKFCAIKTQLRKIPVIIMHSTSANPDDLLKAQAIPEVSAFHSKPMTAEIINAVFSKHFPDCIH